MVQQLEYPWNGIAFDGGMPNVTAPTTTSNPFYFFHTRNIKRVRIYLNPRIVMPVGETTIPGGVQTSLTNIANAAVATVTPTVLESKIEWALMGCTEPISETESRRPLVSWLENFWEKVDDLLGAHAATWGYAILTQPRVVDLWEANNDTDPAVATWADLSWAPTELPGIHTAPWLEAITNEVVTHLRGVGATTNIIVPTIYNPGGANPVRDSHPSGPWVDDEDTWYEATVTPMGTDGYSVTDTYASYESAASDIDQTYRDVWYESAYFTQSIGATTILDPLDLNPPAPLDLPPEVDPGDLPLPPTDLILTPLNGGAHASWSAPTYFGDGDFINYQVVITNTDTKEMLKVFNIPILEINAGPFDNDVSYTLTVYTVTTEGFSTGLSGQFTPSLDLPNPDGDWYKNVADDTGVGGVIVLEEPLLQAFPKERNFRPNNWLKTPDEVEEGF